MSLLFALLSVYAVHAADKKTAGLIKMPSEAVLRERLIEYELDYFANKTNIVAELADKTRHPIGVVTIVDCCLYDSKALTEDMSDCPSYEDMFSMNRNLILRVLLKDEPEALEELKHLGFIHP